MTTDHASRPSERPGAIALLFSLAAAPAGWIAQLVLSYGVASYACQPTGAPRLRPPGFGWAEEHWLFVAINLACLAVTIGAGVVPWRALRTHSSKSAGHIRFLAGCGLMASAGFAIAIGFNTFELFTVPACWRIIG
jgi:hypothetical protein